MHSEIRRNGVTLGVCGDKSLVTMVAGKKMIQIRLTSKDVMVLMPELLKIRGD